MRLVSGSSAVRLVPTGYQFPAREAAGAGFDWDANWLLIGGDVVDGGVTWHFEDPCLTTREARGLLEWLCRVADDDVPGDRAGEDRLSFTELNLDFSVRGREGDLTTLVVTFGHESSPAGADENSRHRDGRTVALTVSAADITRAAQEWARELAQFPER